MLRAYKEAKKEIKDHGKGVREEVRDIISEKNNGKAIGIDKKPAEIFKC